MKFTYIFIPTLIFMFSCKENQNTFDKKESTLKSEKNFIQKSTIKDSVIVQKTDKSIKKEVQNDNSEKKIIDFTFSHEYPYKASVLFSDDDSDIFELKQSNDTIFILSVFENILNRQLNFKFNNNYKIDIVKIDLSLYFSFYQYTIDDRPVYDLDYTVMLNSMSFPVKDSSSIILPDYYNSDEENQVANILGFNDKKDLIDWFKNEHFDSIKSLSLKKQSEVYKMVLNNNNYINCCPEYIKQANEFFDTNFNNINDFDSIGVEFYPSKVKIELLLKNINGKTFKKTIINKEIEK